MNYSGKDTPFRIRSNPTKVGINPHECPKRAKLVDQILAGESPSFPVPERKRAPKVFEPVLDAEDGESE